MITIRTGLEPRAHRPGEVVDERRLGKGEALPRRDDLEGELVTYVREGSLRCRDGRGHSTMLLAGEFQRMTVGPSVQHDETNGSRTAQAQVLRIWVGPPETALTRGHEQKRFSVAERRGGLCAIASRDGRRGSLRLHRNVVVYSALLDPGQHVVLELAEGRSAWLQILAGHVRCGDVTLHAGDGAGASDERALSLTASTTSEIVLVDRMEAGFASINQ